MPARTNKRVIYAHQAVKIRPDGIPGADENIYQIAKGVQEIGISTNFNNTPFFELGQLEIYEDVEELPDIEVTLSKALDGRPLLYHLATSSYTGGTLTTASPTLAGRQNIQSYLTLGVFPDTNDEATGSPPSIVECSGMFPSSLQYTFPVDGIFTESITLVGNDKLWSGGGDIINTTDLARANALRFFGGTLDFASDTPSYTVIPYISGVAYTATNSGIQRRQNLNFTPWASFSLVSNNTGDVNGMAADPFCTILPPDIDGISSSGVNDKSVGDDFDAHVQNITLSVDLGRDQLDELGRRGPYHRFIQFPTEVTCSIETITSSGDLVSATEGGILSVSQASCQAQTNLSNKTIRIATCHNEIFYLGSKNKLASVTYAGGGTDGGNTTTTYNYRNFNVLTVMAFSDPFGDTNNNLSSPTGVGFWNLNADGSINTGDSYVPGGIYLLN